MRVPFYAILAGSRVDGANTSQWVYPGPDGKLAYKTTPTGDRIMDFSTAGYLGGGVPLPAVPVAKTVKPSGGADETASLQAAIDEVAALPLANGFRGAVLLAPGTYTCAKTIYIPASGVVLRGSGTNATTILMTGGKHVAIATRPAGGTRATAATSQGFAAQTSIADAYVPSGTMSFNVADAKGFAVGDVIQIRRPVTAAWVKFMGMDNLVRDGKPQTWIRTGTNIAIERRVAAISGNKISLDVPALGFLRCEIPQSAGHRGRQDQSSRSADAVRHREPPHPVAAAERQSHAGTLHGDSGQRAGLLDPRCGDR